MNIISFVAAFSFIVFGLWTIRGDKLEGEDKKESKFGPIAAVGIAFFLAEMGDKTQLATISLAVKYQSMINVLIGTTLGMIVADAIGIIVGIVMRKHIPERIIKWVSAGIFILFGLAGIYKILSVRIDTKYVLFILLFLAVCSVCGAYYLSRAKKKYEVADEKL
jgi:putative Ca2+/H+ antiporter (TMEM165/GDT1 family)